MRRIGEILVTLGFLVFVMILTGACSSPTREELASLVAKGYYDHLIHGEYEQFLEGKDLLATSNDADYHQADLCCY